MYFNDFPNHNNSDPVSKRDFISTDNKQNSWFSILTLFAHSLTWCIRVHPVWCVHLVNSFRKIIKSNSSRERGMYPNRGGTLFELQARARLCSCVIPHCLYYWSDITRLLCWRANELLTNWFIFMTVPNSQKSNFYELYWFSILILLDLKFEYYFLHNLNLGGWKVILIIVVYATILKLFINILFLRLSKVI